MMENKPKRRTRILIRKKRILLINLALAMVLIVAGAVTIGSHRAKAAVGDTPPHTKNVTDNQDGTYTISLDVVGEAEKKPNNVNVIVILDRSSSMTTQRMNAAKNAINSLANSLYAYNTTSEPNTVEMALVVFSNQASIQQQPTNNSTTFRNAVNGVTVPQGGGTNWEAAMQMANTVNFNDDDQTFVVFVSDGNPTFRYTEGNYPNHQNDFNQQYYNAYGVWGSGQESDNTTVTRCYDHAVDDAQALATKVTPGNFFTIGAFGSVTRMQSLTTDAGAPAANYYSATDTAALNQAMADILAKIETAGFADVEVDDGTTNQVTTSSGEVTSLLELVPNFKYYRSGGTHGSMEPWTDAPEATIVNGEVVWDLSEEGVLENGVRYTVTFDCYPSQTTYDIIAQLKNGDIQYSDLDSEVQKYIVDNGGGSYSLRTNTNAGIKWDDTRDEAGRQESAYTNPDPVKTDAETLTATKEWEGGNPDVDSLEITVLMDDDPFHTATIGSDNDWSTESFISVGIIKNGEVLPGAEGHDFKFAELGSEQYHWELESPVVHPMLIDGTRTMLIQIDDNHPAPSGAATYTINGKDYYADTSTTGLTAVNHRRSNLNLTKVVTGEDAPEDAKFPFQLTVNNSKAPATAPTDDPKHESDYWVWLSIRNENGQGVTGLNLGTGVVEDSGGYYYAPSGTTFNIEIGAGWSLRFLNLPTNTTYTFVEGTLPQGFAFNKAELTQGEDETFTPGQTTTGTIENTKTSYSVKFTNDYALTNLEITKEWVDGDNQDGLRLTPDELKAKLTLSPAVDGAEPTVVDNEDGTYTITYTGLPRFNNGTEVEYTVTESEIDGYTTTGSPASDHGRITNTHEPAETEAPVEKIWDDGENANNTRPTSITVQLYQKIGENGSWTAVSGKTAVLNASNDWKHTEEGLPQYSNGKEISYGWLETAVPTGYTSDQTDPAEKITNTLDQVEVTVTKTFEGIEKSQIPSFSIALTGTGFSETLTAQNAEGDPTESAGKVITYTWKVDVPYKTELTYTETGYEIDGYTWTGTDTGTMTVTPNNNSLSLTNKYERDLGTLVITKALGDGSAQVTIPAGTTFTVTGPDDYSETILYSAFTNGSYTITNLPTGEYKVTETNATIAGYSLETVYKVGSETTDTAEVTKNGTVTIDVINTYEKNTDTDRVDDTITVTKVDQDDVTLEGATFTLTGTGVNQTFTAGTAVIGTGTGDDLDVALDLPDLEAGQETTLTLTLTETEAPAGYQGSSATVTITITGEGTEALDGDTFVTTTTYKIEVTGNPKVINTKITGKDRVDDEITIKKTDPDGELLAGATFTLTGTGVNETFTAGEAVISTGTLADGASGISLKDVLPDLEDGETKELTLTLKETEAPTGYKVDNTEHTVKITGSAVEALDEAQNKFITTTTYTITIDGETTLTVEDEKDTGTERVDDEVKVYKLDEYEEALEGATFTLYNGDAVLGTYTAGTAVISTGDEIFEELLPDLTAGDEKTVTLTLKETEAPEGYVADDTVTYTIKIEGSAEEALDAEQGKFITTTTYTITIDDEEAINVINTPEYGDLEFTKTVPVYENSSPVSFVFHVVAEKSGHKVYDDIVMMTFEAAGTQTATIEGKIPVGAEVTITEIYSGAGYIVTSDASMTTTIISAESEEEAAPVEFTNEYDDELKQGYGILNTFTSDGEDWTWSSDATAATKRSTH